MRYQAIFVAVMTVPVNMTPFDPGTQKKAFGIPKYNYSDIYGSQKTKLLSTNEAFCMNHEKMD